jgi:hypothetical protein
LLAHSACFAPGEPIPRSVLLASLRIAGVARTDTESADALLRLLELGLLDNAQGQASSQLLVRLHRLLGSFVNAKLPVSKNRTAVVEALVEPCQLANDNDDPRPLLPLRPHLRLAAEEVADFDDTLAAKLCHELGRHLSVSGDFGGAVAYLQRAVEIRELVIGPNNPDTARSLAALGWVKRLQGELTAARGYFVRALAIRERVLAPTIPTPPGV